METQYLILFGFGLGMIAFLLWMLIPVHLSGANKEKRKPRGKCPVCESTLYQGERLRSNVIEIGNVEVRTFLHGCPHCLGITASRFSTKRTCPVCKKNVPQDESIMAVSDPNVDKKKLAIRGCKKCYPEGFD